MTSPSATGVSARLGRRTMLAVLLHDHGARVESEVLQEAGQGERPGHLAWRPVT